MPSHAPEISGAATGPVEIGLGLGSNIGDKPANIARALTLLAATNVLEITAVSSVYRSAPWGYVEQDSFANACALARTQLTPERLLAAVKAIETEMGREKTIRWGPRLIDIDILFYGDRPLDEPDLVLPHKELFNRAFVLVPLMEIAPGLHLSGRSIAEASKQLGDGNITKWAAER